MTSSPNTIPAQFPVGDTLDVLGDQVTLKATGPQTGGMLTALEVVARPGSGPPPHTHMHAELFAVLDGVLDVERDGVVSRLRAGDAAAVPCGVVHTYRNTSSADARFLAVLHPAGHERFLAELARDGRGPDGPDPARIAEIGRRHGVTFPAPPRS
jgi:quercetin dioxygenase-like cupin family protein